MISKNAEQAVGLEERSTKQETKTAQLEADSAVLKANNSELIADNAELKSNVTKLQPENACRAAEIADLKGNSSKVQCETHVLCLDKALIASRQIFLCLLGWQDHLHKAGVTVAMAAPTMVVQPLSDSRSGPCVCCADSRAYTCTRGHAHTHIHTHTNTDTHRHTQTPMQHNFLLVSCLAAPFGYRD